MQAAVGARLALVVVVAVAVAAFLQQELARPRARAVLVVRLARQQGERRATPALLEVTQVPLAAVVAAAVAMH
jgi:hypothetical protein